MPETFQTNAELAAAECAPGGIFASSDPGTFKLLLDLQHQLVEVFSSKFEANNFASFMDYLVDTSENFHTIMSSIAAVGTEGAKSLEPGLAKAFFDAMLVGFFLAYGGAMGNCGGEIEDPERLASRAMRRAILLRLKQKLEKGR